MVNVIIMEELSSRFQPVSLCPVSVTDFLRLHRNVLLRSHYVENAPYEARVMTIIAFGTSSLAEESQQLKEEQVLLLVSELPGLFLRIGVLVGKYLTLVQIDGQCDARGEGSVQCLSAETSPDTDVAELFEAGSAVEDTPVVKWRRPDEGEVHDISGVEDWKTDLSQVSARPSERWLRKRPVRSGIEIGVGVEPIPAPMIDYHKD
jgi:hypothetical protein